MQPDLFPPAALHAYADLASATAHPWLVAILPNAINSLDVGQLLLTSEQRSAIIAELSPYLSGGSISRLSRLMNAGQWNEAASSVPWNRVPLSYLKMVALNESSALELLALSAAHRQFVLGGDSFSAVYSAPWQRFHEAITVGIAQSEPAMIDLVTHAQQVGATMHPAGERLNSEIMLSDATAYVQKNGADLALKLTEESRAGLKSLMAVALDMTDAPEESAALTREIIAERPHHAMIGVSKKQGAVMAAKLKGWTEDGSIPSKAIHGLIDDEFIRLVNQRSETLRRTQASTAWNAGLLMAWKRLANVPGSAPIVGLDNNFVSSEGFASRGPGIRPNCRCSQRLTLKTLPSGQTAYVREWITRDSGVSKKCASLAGALALPYSERMNMVPETDDRRFPGQVWRKE